MGKRWRWPWSAEPVPEPVHDVMPEHIGLYLPVGDSVPRAAKMMCALQVAHHLVTDDTLWAQYYMSLTGGEDIPELPEAEIRQLVHTYIDELGSQLSALLMGSVSPPGMTYN